MDSEFLHLVLDAVLAICALAWLLMGLRIQNSTGEVKGLIAQLSTDIQVHLARDDEKHANFDKRLDSLEKRC